MPEQVKPTPPAGPVPLITFQQLKQVAISPDGELIPNATAQQYAAIISEICPVYGINTHGILHEFLAQILHESDCFRVSTENMSYSAARLVEVWPSRFRNTMVAAPYARNPEKLANFVYGGRMGNTRPGDGFLFRGRGPLQLTGRVSYEAFFKFKQKGGGYKWKYPLPPTVEEMAPLISSDPYVGIDSACWEFCVDKRLIPLALADEFIKITKAINGGTIGLKSRQYYYERAKQYLV
jgi:putative chitinase